MASKHATFIRGELPHPDDCMDCPLAVDGRPKRPIVGVGSSHPKFILWGDGPGGNEERLGQPMVGAHGQMVTATLKKLGLNREEIYIGNTILCRPPPNVNKDTAVPRAGRACEKRAQAELARFENVPILALGKHAAQALIGSDFKITELAGTLHTVDIAGNPRQVIPTIHPAMILRGGAGSGGTRAVDLLYWNFLYDMAKVVRLANGTQEPFVTSIKTAKWDPKFAAKLVAAFVPEARAGKLVAVDTETVGVPSAECRRCRTCDGHSALEPRHARLVALGLSTVDRAISVAWNILPEAARAQVRGLFADPDVEKVFHNRLYDEPVLRNHGIPAKGRIHCTLLAHHNAFPGLDHKLQRVASQFFPITPWKAEFRHGKGELQELLNYNALDTLSTARLKPVLEICVKKSGAEKTYEMDLRMAHIARRMSAWGIPVDLKVNRRLAAHFRPLIGRAKAAIIERIEDPAVRERFFDVLATEKAKRVRKTDSSDFLLRHAKRLEETEKAWDGMNVNATDQIVALLKACDVPLFAVTAKGKLSTSKDVLEALTSSPVVRDLLDLRMNEKLYSTFVAPIPRMIEGDGRVHPVWGVHMISGRWNSKPNWQNVSSGSQRKGTPNLRTQVVAPKGRVLIGADSAQLEARVIAMLAGDPYLVKAFMDDLDIHSEFCKEVWPEFTELAASMSEADFRKAVKKEPWSEKRNHMKRAEYGYFYGAAPMTVWQQSFIKEGYDVPLKTVLQMFAVFKKRMPRVELFHAKLFDEVMRCSELKSFLLGRRRVFPTGQADPTIVKNFSVQSSATDIVNTAMDRFYQASRKFRDVKILIHGHDAIDVECWEDDAEKVRDCLVSCMDQQHTVNGITMKFPAEAKIGKSWAEI